MKRVFTAREIKKAAELIKKGEVVAFPTETVYGLGANALDPKAVRKIFLLKGRPADNPLIVHVASVEQVKKIAHLTPKTRRLIKKFWPGPLTIVLKKKEIVPKEVTAGLDTVAVRMPKNKIALGLIRLAGVPIAAPSANISGRPSPTTYKHVIEDFKTVAVIRHKKCEIGLESTVVDLSAKRPVLLRPGGVSFEELKNILPDLVLAKKTKKAKSPGMKYRHYSPNARIVLFEKNAVDKMERYAKMYKDKRVKVIKPPKNLKRFSRELFSLFRQCDKEGIEIILIAGVEEKGLGLAIMDRLRRAAADIVR